MAHLTEQKVTVSHLKRKAYCYVRQSTLKQISLQEALRMSGANKTQATKLLGVSRLTVYRQLEKCPAE